MWEKRSRSVRSLASFLAESMTLSDREYLEKHGVEQAITKAVVSVLRDRPQAALDMFTWFLRGERCASNG